jgi:hypothetical protein
MNVSEPQERQPRQRSKTMYWAAAFFAGMFSMPVIGRHFEWGPFWSMASMIAPMLLLIPMIKSAEKSAAKSNALSHAAKNYNRRSLIWAFSYVLLLFAAISIDQYFELRGPVKWLVAALPSLPIFFFIWAVGRYLTEEQDEYVRMRQVRHALFATGLLLGIATFWGFLETFQLVPHIPGWAAVPLWALGLALSQLTDKVRST